MTKILKTLHWQWVLLIILAFIWGSSFILMKKGLIAFSGDQVAAFRISFSFFIFLPLIIKNVKKIKRQFIFPLSTVGIIGTGIPAFLFANAQETIDSALAGMLNSMVPLSALTIGLLFFNMKVKWHNILGVVIGFFGAAFLIIGGKDSIQIDDVVAPLLIIIATLCYGLSINVTKYRLSELDGFSISALSFFIIGPIAVIYLLFSDFTAALETGVAGISLFYIFLLSFFSSSVAVVFFNFLIKYASPIFAASVTYIIPIFAIGWGILDGEDIQTQDIAWISLIISGVYLVNKKKLNFTLTKFRFSKNKNDKA